MKNVLWGLPLAVAACALMSAPAAAQTPAQGSAASSTSAVELKVGDMAPDFTLQATDGKTYSLSKDLRGKWVALAWFPKAFTAG
jgi:peroxiredoxin Q/BCP